MKTFKFGDKILNHWAGEKNPRRIGFVIKTGIRYLELTDMNGDFWEHDKKDEKLELIGSYLLPVAPQEQPQTKTAEEILERLDNLTPILYDLGNRMYSAWGTDSYNERCVTYDIRD